MHKDSVASSTPLGPYDHAQAAQRAIADETKEESIQQIAAWRDNTNEAYIADHIRGMVASTMGTLPNQASVVTQENAAHWKNWALGIADSLGQPRSE